MRGCVFCIIIVTSHAEIETGFEGLCIVEFIIIISIIMCSFLVHLLQYEHVHYSNP